MSDWTDLQIEPDMDLVKDAAAHQLSEDIKDLRALLQAAQKENEEQARLLAMSADREEKLRDALKYIAGLDTSQGASPQQCSAVAVAMEALQ